jgi:hypothetical protein
LAHGAFVGAIASLALIYFSSIHKRFDSKRAIDGISDEDGFHVAAKGPC